jgi:hypothetical protein
VSAADRDDELRQAVRIDLFAIGIAIFAYLLTDEGTSRRLPIASMIAWTGAFVSLALDGRKRRAVAPEKGPASPGMPPLMPTQNGRKSHRSDYRSAAPEYTHQISHF